MKKFLALGSAALLLTCGGCQEESIVNEPVSAQPVSVRFALTLREDIEPFLRTRNLPGGLPGEPSAANASPDEEETPSTQPVSTLSYIEYAVYDNDTEELIEHRRYEVDGQDGSLQVQDELTAGIYKVCFLAHGVTDATFDEESSLVTFPEVEDTFWGFQEIEVDATQTDQSFSVGLARAVAGIELVPTDAVPEQVDFDILELCSGESRDVGPLSPDLPARRKDASRDRSLLADRCLRGGRQAARYSGEVFLLFVRAGSGSRSSIGLSRCNDPDLTKRLGRGATPAYHHTGAVIPQPHHALHRDALYSQHRRWFVRPAD